jgi:hypothetical protein
LGFIEWILGNFLERKSIQLKIVTRPAVKCIPTGKDEVLEKVTKYLQKVKYLSVKRYVNCQSKLKKRTYNKRICAIRARRKASFNSSNAVQHFVPANEFH